MQVPVPLRRTQGRVGHEDRVILAVVSLWVALVFVTAHPEAAEWWTRRVALGVAGVAGGTGQRWDGPEDREVRLRQRERAADAELKAVAPDLWRELLATNVIYDMERIYDDV